MARKIKIDDEVYKLYWDEVQPKTAVFDLRDLRAYMANVPPWHIGKLFLEVVDAELGIISREDIKGYKNKHAEDFKEYLFSVLDAARKDYIRSYLFGKFKSKGLDEIGLQNAYVSPEDILKDNTSPDIAVDNFLHIWGEETGFIVDASVVASHIKKAIVNFISIGLKHDYEKLRKMIREQHYAAHDFPNFVQKNWAEMARKSL